MEFKGTEIKNWLFGPYKWGDELGISIHWKPTAASTADYFVSNHPMEQKMAVCRYMWHRKYDLPFNRRKTEKRQLLLTWLRLIVFQLTYFMNYIIRLELKN